jgi:hypothetical protein
MVEVILRLQLLVVIQDLVKLIQIQIKIFVQVVVQEELLVQ